jgi:hypothetical protein
MVKLPALCPADVDRLPAGWGAPDPLPMPSGRFFFGRHGLESTEILLRPSRCRSFKTPFILSG